MCIWLLPILTYLFQMRQPLIIFKVILWPFINFFGLLWMNHYKFSVYDVLSMELTGVQVNLIFNVNIPYQTKNYSTKLLLIHVLVLHTFIQFCGNQMSIFVLDFTWHWRYRLQSSNSENWFVSNLSKFEFLF